MPTKVVVRTARSARLYHVPLLLATRGTPLVLRAGTLAVVQAVLGSARRWRILQVLIAASTVGVPGLSLLRPFAFPLLSTWLYGVGSRIFAPAHARSLKFWKKVVPIYLGYKSTQTQLAVRKASPQKRDKTWNVRHDWGADKVCELVRLSQIAQKEVVTAGVANITLSVVFFHT